MTVELEGLQARLTHGPSSSVLFTVPPKDNGGTGATFSPTDLVGAALGSCALTTMALLAAKEGLDFRGGKARVEKVMVGPPRRIGTLALEIEQPAAVNPEHRARLEDIARTCPVARSLHPDLQVPLSFTYR